MGNNSKDTKKLANELIMVSLVMVGLLLVWSASQRIAEFNERQLELAEHSVRAAASEAELLVKGYKSAVNIFAEENTFFLSTLELWPQDAASYGLLQEKVDRYFPERFTFTLADSSGNTLLEGFEGMVGKLCKQDIQVFAANEGQYSVYQHQTPNGIHRHFDIMSYWQGSDSDKEVFFISFSTDRLERILENAQVPGHRLMLVRQDLPGQVDVTPEVNRAVLPADGQLGVNELRRISYSQSVPGTRWDMEVLPDNTLYSQAHSSILIQTLLVFVGFIVISVIMRMILLDQQD